MIYNIYNLIYVYVYYIYIHTIIYHIVWYLYIKPHQTRAHLFGLGLLEAFWDRIHVPSCWPSKNSGADAQQNLKMMFFNVFFGWTKLWYKLSWCSPRYHGNYAWDRDQKRVSTIASKGHPLLPAMLACGHGTGTGRTGRTGTGASGCQVLRSSPKKA